MQSPRPVRCFSKRILVRSAEVIDVRAHRSVLLISHGDCLHVSTDEMDQEISRGDAVVVARPSRLRLITSDGPSVRITFAEVEIPSSLYARISEKLTVPLVVSARHCPAHGLLAQQFELLVDTGDFKSQGVEHIDSPFQDFTTGNDCVAESRQWRLDSLMEFLFLQSIASAHALETAGPDEEASINPAMSDQQIGPVLREIWSCPAKPWTLPLMAKQAKLSRSAFAERFRRLVGQSPLQYLMDVRMTLACKLLTTETLNISTIATMVGYENGSSFSNSFKKWSQQSPLAFRKSRRS